MKHRTVILFVAMLALASCATTAPTTASVDPCKDSVLVALEHRGLNTLTGQEYATYVEKRKRCYACELEEARMLKEQAKPQVGFWDVAVPLAIAVVFMALGPHTPSLP